LRRAHIGLAGRGDGGVAVPAHLLLVCADRRDESAVAASGAARSGAARVACPGAVRGDAGQHPAQQRGVLQRGIRARTAGRAHRVNGVAEYRDPARPPARHGHRGAHPDQERLVHVGQRMQGPQVRVPGPDQVRGQRVQRGRAHRAEFCVRYPQVFPVSGDRPHQVIPGGREVVRSGRRRACRARCHRCCRRHGGRLLRTLPQAHQSCCHADPAADHRREALRHRGRHPVKDLRAQWCLAVDAALAGIGRFGGGQVLAADRRVDAIRADQQVRVRLPPVGEVQPYPVLARLVPGQFMAERQPVS
jgi:hypothetical protein